MKPASAEQNWDNHELGTNAMSAGAGGAAGASAASAAVAAQVVANAVRAMGAIVKIEPDGFQSLWAKQKEPLIVCAVGGFFTTSYQYLMPYRGLVFYTKSPYALNLPGNAEVVTAKAIWIPS
jgi:hypothetical protein